MLVGEYIANQGRKTESAYNYYMITEGIHPYLQFNKKVSKAEADLFYEKYYKNCDYKSNIPVVARPIIPLFHVSILLGRAYVRLLNTLIAMRRLIVKRI